MLEIRHLQYITEIVRHNSFTKAAEALHLTQPTISKIVKNLENELGVEVFVREGRPVKLTAAGELIVTHAGPILQLFDQLEAALHDLTYLNTGSIKLGIPPMAGSSFFPHVIKKFQEQYPNISIKMMENGAKRIEESLSEGILDVGVALWPIDEALFDSFTLVEDRLKVIMHPSHRLADREQLQLAELAQERFILFNSDFALHDRIIAECRRVGFEPHIVYESSQWDFIGEMVGADLGIAMLPNTMCRQLNPGKVRAAALTDPVIPWRLDMAWRREGYMPHAAREWIKFTKNLFAGAAK